MAGWNHVRFAGIEITPRQFEKNMFEPSGNPAMPHARMKPGFYLRSSISAEGAGGGGGGGKGCHPVSGISRNASLLSK